MNGFSEALSEKGACICNIYLTKVRPKVTGRKSNTIEMESIHEEPEGFDAYRSQASARYLILPILSDIQATHNTTMS